MGDEIVKGKEELDLFDHIDITDTVVNYHKLSMISSLLTMSDIITHCKRMEICRYGTNLELERVSDKVRFMVFKSCLDGEMQRKEGFLFFRGMEGAKRYTMTMVSYRVTKIGQNTTEPVLQAEK